MNLKNESEDIQKIEKVFDTILRNDETEELMAEESMGMIQNGQYTISLQAFSKYGISEWSEPVTINKEDVVRLLMLFVTFLQRRFYS